MTKIKMLVMGALMAGVIGAAAPAKADDTPYLHSEYAYQNNPAVKKRVAEPTMMKMHHHKKHHGKKMHHRKHHKHHADASRDNYPDECNKPPCRGTSN